MTASMRFAETDYPGEVEDMFAETDPAPSCVAVAGYALVASATSTQALVFAIASGSGVDPIALPLQRHTSHRSPSLSAWPASASADKLHCMGVAVLTGDGVLRVYPRVRIGDPGRHRCDQIRVGSALAASVGIEPEEMVSLKVVRAVDARFYVFGGRGSVAVVRDVGGRLMVRPLGRADGDERGSLRFGKMFYSAIRSIGGSARWDADWERGEGVHEIVACTATNTVSGVVCVKSGGVVERWGEDGMLWSFNVFDFHAGRDPQRSVLTAGLTNDDTLAVLVRSAVPGNVGHGLVTFDVQSVEAIPRRIEMTVPLNDGQVDADFPCLMVLAGDIAYFYISSTRTIAWLSVARGVPAEGQVQGNTSLENDVGMLQVINASFGMPEAAATGGIAAFIRREGVWIVSSAVPAPVSLDKDFPNTSLTSIKDAAPIFWRSFLQYSADQKGAAKATLCALIASLCRDGFDVVEGLSELVERASRKITTSIHDPDTAPMDLLIDTELKKKEEQHKMFLSLLSDAEVFSEVRPDAPSITDDRLWSAIQVNSRSAVVTDGEKLSSARRVRELENRYARDGFAHRFNEALSASVLGSEHIRGSERSGSRVGTMLDEAIAEEGPSVLAEALILGGSDMSSTRGGRARNDSATRLYRFPHEFQRFLPALDRCLSDKLAKMQTEQNITDENEDGDGSHHRRAAQNAVLLSCEAVIEVMQGSRRARESTVELLESIPGAMDGVQNWMFDSRTCGSILMKIAQKALDIGSKTRQMEGGQLFRAAVIVIDEILSRTPFDEPNGNTRDGRLKRSGTAKKRRRLDSLFTGSERGRELRTALELLRRNGLDQDAFRLAEKHGDYATMLSLRVSSRDFDGFMEESLEKFGSEFALFAFDWLEERGELRLLLRGHSVDPESTLSGSRVGRSHRMKELLSSYFRVDRKNLSNLAWIHWISQGDLDAAVESLVTQTRRVSTAGKEGSAINSMVLSSIARLAIRARGDAQGSVADDMSTASQYINGRLLLSKLQKTVDADSDCLLSTEELIRRFVDESPTVSESLAERVVLASEALEFSEVEEDSLQALQDYIWKRCIERQSDLWVPLVDKMGSVSDVEMRQRLKATALYKAATQITMTETRMTEMIGRGVLAATEFEKQDCVPQMATLVKAAVSLAVA